MTRSGHKIWMYLGSSTRSQRVLVSRHVSVLYAMSSSSDLIHLGQPCLQDINVRGSKRLFPSSHNAAVGTSPHHVRTMLLTMLYCAKPRNFYSFCVHGDAGDFVRVQAARNPDAHIDDPYALVWIPHCFYFFEAEPAMDFEMVTVTSSRTFCPRTFIIFWNCDGDTPENLFIRRNFRLPWHGDMLVFATSMNDPCRIVNLRGPADMRDIRNAIGKSIHALCRSSRLQCTSTLDTFIRNVLEIGV